MPNAPDSTSTLALCMLAMLLCIACGQLAPAACGTNVRAANNGGAPTGSRNELERALGLGAAPNFTSAVMPYRSRSSMQAEHDAFTTRRDGGSNPPASTTLRLSHAGAVKLARVAANEDSRPLRPEQDGGSAGEPTADTLAIMQTVRAWATWRRTTQDRAIEHLAPHVTGTRAAKLRRHAVYGSLPASGSAQPVAWLPSDGDWRVHGPLWAAFRDAVERIARDGFGAPCPRAPVAWGGPMDDHIAESRGLERLDCGDTVNSYWALPAHRATVPARLAKGER